MDSLQCLAAKQKYLTDKMLISFFFFAFVWRRLSLRKKSIFPLSVDMN
jgi:hypothetical protein